ncbi:MAG: ABC transporter permease [Gemmatimonadales bacterium]|nr:ABC transporter permease [Gemmatimonadales bacterium]
MVIFSVAGKDLLRFLGDRRALVVSLALPLVLTFIMGLSFGGGLFGKSGISAIKIALVAEGIPELLRDRFTEGLEESGFFSVSWVDSNAADFLVRNGEVSAAVVLPDDFLRQALSFEEIPILIWKDPGSSLKAGIVEEVLSRGLREYQAGEAAYLGLWPEDAAAAGDSSAVDLVEKYFEGAFSTLWQSWREVENDSSWAEFQERTARIMDRQVALVEALGQPGIELEVQDKVSDQDVSQSEDINLFNYFLPTFAVFFLMFGVAGATGDFHRERKMGTLQRQLMSPLRALEFVLGKWLSASLQGSLQLMVLFLGGAILFQVNLGPDPWSLPLAIVLTCTAATGFFLLLTLLCRDEKMADNLKTIVVLISAMLGGNMVPVDSLPPWISAVGQFFFNYWANLSFSHILVSNRNIFEEPQPLLILFGATIGLLGASLIVFILRQRRGGLL